MVSDQEDSQTDVESEEFDFLIAKYLSVGPFKDVGEILARKLEEKKALPKRLDWTGKEHNLTFDELNETYGHVEPDYLLKVAQNVGRTCEDGSRGNNVEGISSILQSAGCGRLDALRTGEGSRKAQWTTKDLIYSKNPWVPRTVPAIVASTSAFPTWPHLWVARQIHGFLNPEVQFSKKYYAGFQLHKRILGHLAAVFNVIFDRSGKFLVTGSDDRLLKLWSAIDGRLLFTFRGHSAEIVFMAINDENTMLASVATDRTIRIWNLLNGAQMVVDKEHTGFVSSLKFSPSVRGNVRFLVASSMDGNIFCWKYDAKTLEFLPTEVSINEKTPEMPETKICSISFSAGGTFLASGSCDAFVRVYNLMGDGHPEGRPVRILQKALHTDRVDSIEYCHVGDRFLTGSRDGTGRIWQYSLKNEWTTILLNSAQSLSVPGSEKHDPKAYKRKVTMVGWSRNDQYCILASDDNVMRVFDSFDGRLVFELQGHTDTVYVLESHPFDTNIYLTAGHDAKLVIWSLIDGSKLCQFEQWINGHGHSPFVDAKWSPDGTMIAATDMFGSLNIYGPGKGASFFKTPDEQFFHTDFRPLMRDNRGFVVDEQTQLVPNLMQPPFLVNAAGVPYPPDIQRMVPGRGDNHEQLQVPDEPLPALDAALNALNNQAIIPDAVQPAVALHPVGVQYIHPPDPYKRTYIPQPLTSLIASSLYRKRKDLALLEIEKLREHCKPTGRDGSSRRVEQPEFSLIAPPRALLFNGEAPPVAVDPDAAAAQLALAAPQPATFPPFDNFDDSEDEDYEAEGVANSSDESEASDMDASIASVETRQRRARIPADGVRRSSRKRKQREESDEADFSDPMDEEEEDEEEDLQLIEDNAVQEDAAPSTSRRSPPRRSNLRSRKTNGGPRGSRSSRPEVTQKAPPAKRRKLEQPEQPVLHTAVVPKGVDTTPPKWLSEIQPKRSPYFPQIDDVLYYFVQGHKLYNEVAHRDSVADRSVKNNRPFDNRHLDLNTVEIVKVTTMKFMIKKPSYRRVVEILVERLSEGLEQLDPKKKSFKICLQEIPDVEDFLILKQFVDASRSFQYTVGQRVRTLFLNPEKQEWNWFNGEIKAVEAADSNFADSDFHILQARWDDSDEPEGLEKLSPWDVFPLEGDRQNEPEDGILLTDDEMKGLAYKPQEGDWDCFSLEAFRARVLPLLGMIRDNSRAEFFNAPVDYTEFPDYSAYVAYPVDLMLIKSRLENGFYRHRSAMRYDIEQIPINAKVYNGPTSDVVRDANIIADVCLEVIRDESIRNNVRTVFTKYTKLWTAKWKELPAVVPVNGAVVAGPSHQNGHVNGELAAESESEPDEEEGSEFAPDEDESEDDGREHLDYSAEEDSALSAEDRVNLADADYASAVNKRPARRAVNGGGSSRNTRKRPPPSRSKDQESPETSISTNRKKARQAAGRHQKRALRRGGPQSRRAKGAAKRAGTSKRGSEGSSLQVSLHGRPRKAHSYAEMDGSDGDVTNTPSPADSGATVGSSSNDTQKISRSGRVIKTRRLD